jgi:hypothetical protein
LLLTIGKPLYNPVSIPTVKGNATTAFQSVKGVMKTASPLKAPISWAYAELEKGAIARSVITSFKPVLG